MFGIIHALVTLTGLTISGVKGSLQNQENYQRGMLRDYGKEVKRNTYYDRKGVERSRSNNEILTTRKDYNSGDIIQTNKYCEVVRNLSEEQRKLDFEKAKPSARKNKKTVVLYNERGLSYSNFHDKNYHGSMVMGHVYKDIETGKNLYCRLLRIGYWNPKTDEYTVFKSEEESKRIPNGCHEEKVKFFMNEWGLFERLADSELEERQMYIDAGLGWGLIPMEKIEEFFKEFNAVQRKSGWRGRPEPSRYETNLVKKVDDADDYYLNNKNIPDQTSEHKKKYIEDTIAYARSKGWGWGYPK